MADRKAARLAKMSAGSNRRGNQILINSHELSLGDMLNSNSYHNSYNNNNNYSLILILIN